MGFMSWLFTGIALAGTILNVHKLRVCFLLWIVANIGFAIMDGLRNDYGRVALDIVQIGFAVYGYVVWGKDKNG